MTGLRSVARRLKDERLNSVVMLKSLHCFTVKIKAIQSFETSLAVPQSTGHNILDGLNTEQHRYDNLKICTR